MTSKENKNLSFAESLINIILPIREFMEITRGRELPPVINGVRVYFDQDDKSGFQIARQYDRPTEYLQALLDIVRVEFDPNPLGTFQLNSNLGFILDSIPKSDFQLGYISISSQESQDFHDLWYNNALPYMAKCGYDIYKINVFFAVVTTGYERHGSELMGEVHETLKSGFSIDEVLTSFSKALATDSDPGLRTNSNTYAGFCLDPVLGSRLRLSLWFFIKNREIDRIQ